MKKQEPIVITREEKDSAKKLLEFIGNSPTSYHTIYNIEQRLQDAGFTRQYETECFQQDGGGKHYVIRNDSSIIAYRLPKVEAKKFTIVATHSDTPCFKLKEKPEIAVEQQYVKLNTEKYGGMILSSWLDRPLGIAGRIIVREQEELVTRLVDLSSLTCVIPNLAIHMNREINQGYEYNPQVDMLPLFTMEENLTLQELIGERYGVAKEEILGSDLFLYHKGMGQLVGAKEEFVVSPRLDDLQCTFAALEAFLHATDNDAIQVLAVFDSEEVGSATRQGADSDFLETILKRIVRMIERELDFESMIANSFFISADNAHGVHPNKTEKADPTNRPYLNRGVVLKFHGSQKYTTDGVTAAKIRDWAYKANVEIQTFANRSDTMGGSTLGNLSTTHLSIPSADIGLAQLSMHSAMETAGTKDTYTMMQLLKEFY